MSDQPEARSEGPRIECVPDGPLRVHGLPSLRNSKGQDLPVKEVMALCRCGGSAKKPFCDGTHRTNGFTSAKGELRSPDQVDTYRGVGITIHDNRSLCAHAGRCTDGLPATFRIDQEPFVDPDADPVARIVEIVGKCPSGALAFTLHDAAAEAARPDPAPMIVVTPGPYAVVGRIDIDQPRNAGASPVRCTLCRCGASRNKPFCDGSHWDIDFRDEAN